MGFQSVLDTDTFSGQGKSAVGGISSGIYSELLDTPENKVFVERYRAKYKAMPGIFEETGYSALRCVDEAAKAVGGKIEDRPAFLAAMAKVSFVAPRGPISFDRFGNAVGNIHTCAPSERATCWSTASSRPIRT